MKQSTTLILFALSFLALIASVLIGVFLFIYFNSAKPGEWINLYFTYGAQYIPQWVPGTKGNDTYLILSIVYVVVLAFIWTSTSVLSFVNYRKTNLTLKIMLCYILMPVIIWLFLSPVVISYFARMKKLKLEQLEMRRKMKRDYENELIVGNLSPIEFEKKMKGDE